MPWYSRYRITHIATVPFYMLTLFCLARGSERFHRMFLESRLYKKTVGAYERDKALTLRTKLSILASVTTIMLIGAYFLGIFLLPLSS